MEDTEYAQELVPRIYEWIFNYSKNESSRIIKISDCKDQFKAIPIKYISIVFDMLVADGRIKLQGASRIQQYVINQDHADFSVKMKAWELEIEQSKTIERKPKGLKVRDPNISTIVIDKAQKTCKSDEVSLRMINSDPTASLKRKLSPPVVFE